MTKAKGLQKVTQSEAKINTLFTQDKPITGPDIRALKFNTDEINDMILAMYAKINSLSGCELDDFLEKVNILLSDDTKNWLWENNNNNITAAISNLMHEKNRMPSKSEIAKETKLSRQTIHKHLNEYSSHPLYLQQIEQFRFLTSRVLARVYHYACEGNMSAARLYFDVTGCLGGQNGNSTLIQNQHNYLIINGIVLSQESVKKLNPEQLETIESILKTALPEAEKIEAKEL
jgi:DNA-binding phage protein